MSHDSEQKPVLYLDIDGVLLAKDPNKAYGVRLAIGAIDFIKYAVENFEVYWLTTHCPSGDGSRAVQAVNGYSEEDLTPWLLKIGATTWGVRKTDAIDMHKPFLWFDDNCLYSEKAVLKEANCANSWIEVDLQNYPDQMVHDKELLSSFIDDSDE